MRPCGERVRRWYCATPVSAGIPWTHQTIGNLMVGEIGDPTEDTGKGAGGAIPDRSRRDRTTGAAQYAVAEEAFMLVGGRTEITVE